jgi:excisionase family DNA binding protein
MARMKQEDPNKADILAAYTIPEAGAMVGLSRNGSYDAVRRGEIPVLKFGRIYRVPKAVWDRKLGLTGAS